MTGVNSGGAYSRRGFLSTTSLAVAGLAVGARRLSASEVPRWLVPNTVFQDRLDPDWLQVLATAAIDAAKGAGATYADVRVAECQTFFLYKGVNGRFAFSIGGQILRSFGIRAATHGGWGFVHDDVLTVDAITAAARGATRQAQQMAKVAVDERLYVAAPAVTGTWRTPMEIDPFTVPIHEQMGLMLAWMDVCSGVRGVGGFPSFTWNRETRVFASTEGSLVTQHLHQVYPQYNIGGSRWMGAGNTELRVPLYARTGGYEVLANPAIYDQIRATGAEVQRYMALPGRSLDVGRYPVVMDGTTLGTVFSQTVGPALELDRVLGEEADASGTSYLGPIPPQVGRAIGTPILNITADRALPSVTSVQWDDEGVVPVAGPVVTAGQVVDYQTSRRTAAALAGWYQPRHQPLGSRGCAVAPEARHPVQVRCGHLTVAPSDHTATIDDLIREMPHGVLVLAGQSVATDQELTTGNISSNDMLMIEVQKGRMVGRLKDCGLEWNTVPFLKHLLTLGDKSTMQEATGSTFKGIPWHDSPCHVTAPAGFIAEVAALDIGRVVL